jgi:hypothetical protein
MSAGVKFLKPTRELIEAVAADMRQADVDEIWASGHLTPLSALLDGCEISDYTVVVVVNDVPCVVLGLVIRDILTGTGVPWLLGTDGALKYKRHFLIQVPEIINEMLTVCPRLFNYVHTENKVSIKWLKRIGFTLGDPVEYGCEGELFHKFYLERSD